MINILRLLSLFIGFIAPLVPVFGYIFLNNLYILPIIGILILLTSGLFHKSKLMEKISKEDVGYKTGMAYRIILRGYLLTFIPGNIYLFHLAATINGINIILILINYCLISLYSTLVLHEFSHSIIFTDSYFSKIYSIALGYGHFKKEHLAHHEYNGVGNFCCIAKKRENIYNFVLRNVKSGFFSAFKKEKYVLKEGKIDHSNNSILFNYACSALVLCMIFVYFGWIGVLFYLFQLIFVMFCLYGLTYINHYGLGVNYFNGGQLIAWEHSGVIDCLFLMNYGLHERHHKSPLLPSFLLNNRRAPTNILPYGYGVMFLIALVPPVWFKIMNEKLKEMETEWGGL